MTKLELLCKHKHVVLHEKRDANCTTPGTVKDEFFAFHSTHTHKHTSDPSLVRCNEGPPLATRALSETSALTPKPNHQVIRLLVCISGTFNQRGGSQVLSWIINSIRKGSFLEDRQCQTVWNTLNMLHCRSLCWLLAGTIACFIGPRFQSDIVVEQGESLQESGTGCGYCLKDQFASDGVGNRFTSQLYPQKYNIRKISLCIVTCLKHYVQHMRNLGPFVPHERDWCHLEPNSHDQHGKCKHCIFGHKFPLGASRLFCLMVT